MSHVQLFEKLASLSQKQIDAFVRYGDIHQIPTMASEYPWVGTMILLWIGFCAGLLACGFIEEKMHKDKVKELKEKAQAHVERITVSFNKRIENLNSTIEKLGKLNEEILDKMAPREAEGGTTLSAYTPIHFDSPTVSSHTGIPGHRYEKAMRMETGFTTTPPDQVKTD